MAKVAHFITAVALTLAVTHAAYDSECQEGWSSCDASLWVSPKYNPQDPLSSYTPGDIRGPLEYEIKFSCRGRRNGYYADLDHSCKVWHYCNTTREINQFNGLATWTYTHFSYACLEEGTRYDQVQKECVPEPKSIVRCRDSEYYYPTGDYVHDVAVANNNRLVPVRCPTSVSDAKCSIQKDHISLQGCPESPGAVIKFYAPLNDIVPPSPVDEAEATTDTPVSPYSAGNGVPSLVPEVPKVSENIAPVPYAPVPVPAPSAPVQPALYHHNHHQDDDGHDHHDHHDHHHNSPDVDSAAVRRPLPDLSGRKTISKIYAPSNGRKVASPAHAGRKSLTQGQSKQYVDGEQLIFPRRLSQPLVVPTIGALALRDVAFEPVPVPPTNSSESVEADFLGLPVGSTKILGDKIDTSFDCTGRSYGYYADVKNQCKVYHVCSPKTDEFGVRFYEHFSFVCAEGLIFDQRKITCVPSREASHQCSDSERYFEKTSEQFHKEHESFVANRKVVPTEATPVDVTSPAAARAVPASPVTGRKLTILRVKSIEPEAGVIPSYSKVNGPRKSVGPPRVFLKEPTVPTRVESDEYDHDAEEVALRGDQSPAARGEQVNEPLSSASPPPPPPPPPSSPSPPVKRPIAPYRPVNSKDASYPRKGYAPRQVVESPVKRQYSPRVPVSSPKRVVYRLKKGNRAPTSYSSVKPYLGHRISHNPQVEQKISEPSLAYAPKAISHSPSISQGVDGPAVPAAAPQQITHNPSISQYIDSPAPASAPQYISHKPSVSQYLGAPESASAPQSISHNPSISQYIGSPAPASAPQYISHNPSVSQDLGAPESASAPQSISHNPSISQYIGSPAPASAPRYIAHNPSASQYIGAPASSSSPQALSHNPSIVQYIGAPGVPSSGASISHSPMISQYVPDVSGSLGYPGSQAISHNPSIHQVIVRAQSSRPSSRVTW